MIKGPVDASIENDEKEVNIDMAPSANSIQDEVFRCSICPRSFDKSYQRRIHERYIHQKMSEEVTQQVKCPSCKSLCKNDHQYKLHKELYCDVAFQCKQCSESFKRISLLATHLKLAHRANPGGKTKEILIPSMSVMSETNQKVPAEPHQII